MTLLIYNNIIRLIELRRMRWAGHVTPWEGREIRIKFVSENMKGSDQTEIQGTEEKIILE
jgi:hypothetical protein